MPLERELVPLLLKDDRITELTSIGPPGVTNLDWAWPANDGLRGWRQLRAWLTDWRPDVVFIPTSRTFPWSLCPVVTMVRNMEPLVIPFSAPTWSERLRNLARRHAARASARQADRVIAVSEFVRHFVTDKWCIPDQRVGVVNHGVNGIRPSEMRQPAATHGSERHSIFSCGSIRPARGIEDIVDALAVLRQEGREVTLWFGGSPSPGAEPYLERLQSRARAAGILDQIRWLDHLSPAEMQWCFTNASAFVMTSRVEACPNIVLEAMACGARSLSTDSAPMPEFFQDAATYYPAGNGHLLARAHLCMRGVERSRLYSWERASGRTVDELLIAVKHYHQPPAFDAKL